MSEFQTELPADVDVQTVTFIAFSDRRPTEIVMAGTSDDEVTHDALTEQGERLFTALLLLLVPDHLKEIPDGLAG